MKRLLFTLPLFLAFWMGLPAPEATADQRYDRPRIDGTRLDWCREWAQNCGKPAADAFCRLRGHRRSTSHAKDSGVSERTRIITSGQLCGPGCDSFRYVTCETRARQDPPRRDVRRFNRPRIGGGVRLDWCREWGQNCGKPAADAFCRTRGFRTAGRFGKAEDVGRSEPTRVITSGNTCNGPWCDGFEYIECQQSRGGSAGQRRSFVAPMFRGARLDWCREWGRNCGQPAADAFCRANNFRRAHSFEKANDIGDRAPTRIISSGQVCGDRGCDGFRVIVCAR